MAEQLERLDEVTLEVSALVHLRDLRQQEKEARRRARLEKGSDGEEEEEEE